jgi:hypothetical protein
MKEVLLHAMQVVGSKLFKVSISLLSFFAPINFVFWIIGISIILDTFFGRWSAKKVAEREGKDVRLEVTSKKTRNGLVSKIITYNIAIGTLFIIDFYMLNDVVLYFFESFPIHYLVTKLVGIIFVLIEFDSIDEKYYIVTGKRLKQTIKSKINDGKTSVLNISDFASKLKNKKDENS